MKPMIFVTPRIGKTASFMSSFLCRKQHYWCRSAS